MPGSVCTRKRMMMQLIATWSREHQCRSCVSVTMHLRENRLSHEIHLNGMLRVSGSTKVRTNHEARQKTQPTDYKVSAEVRPPCEWSIAARTVVCPVFNVTTKIIEVEQRSHGNCGIGSVSLYRELLVTPRLSILYIFMAGMRQWFPEGPIPPSVKLRFPSL